MKKFQLGFFEVYTLLLLILTVCSCTPPQKSTAESSAPDLLNSSLESQTLPSIHSTLSSHSPHKPTHPPVALSSSIKKFCKLTHEKFSHYGWGKSYCEDYKWHHVRNSVLGTPLVWTSFGQEGPSTSPSKQDTTLVLCGVHGDEITPIKFCFDIIHYLRHEYENLYADKLILVAPVANPDSFFKGRPTRINHRGVDINRNFPTKDWEKFAHNLWTKQYQRDPRRNPGPRPMSEPEVVFQINLIKRYAPDKIITVHAPLTMLDYDGPNSQDKNEVSKHGQKANELLLQMSKSADGYRIRNYKTFPGSLGNWAGVERKIPTYTLELPTSDPRESQKYWNLFKVAIHQAFSSDLRIGQRLHKNNTEKVAKK